MWYSVRGREIRHQFREVFLIIQSAGQPSIGKRERGRHLKLAGGLPKRGVVLVELHCVGKHELDVLRELSDIRVLLPLEVFLKKGPSKSPTTVAM